MLKVLVQYASPIHCMYMKYLPCFTAQNFSSTAWDVESNIVASLLALQLSKYIDITCSSTLCDSDSASTAPHTAISLQHVVLIIALQDLLWLLYLSFWLPIYPLLDRTLSIVGGAIDDTNAPGYIRLIPLHTL